MAEKCIGNYRLLNVIHTGEHSQLWQAYDDGHHRRIALKALMDKSVKDTEQIGYLRQEFKAGTEVKHPNTIEIYTFDFDRDTPYLTLEWFAAPNLKRRIRTKEEREKIIPYMQTIIEQAADGLGYFHSKNWVHRDIKPENFLVTDEGKVKLIDYGLAKRPSGWLDRVLSFNAKRQGTPTYMSPEQIRCSAIDQRADVYSFACMVYEFIAGTPPFTGVSREELFNKHLKTAVPSIDAADPNITHQFAALLRRSMSKNASERPATAKEFLEEMRKMRLFKVQPQRPKTTGNVPPDKGKDGPSK